MWIVDIIAAVLFVGSSGILFNERYRKNIYLVVAAGVIALFATYLMTRELVIQIVKETMALQSSSGTTPTQKQAPSTSTPTQPLVSHDTGPRPSTPDEQPATVIASPDDIRGAQAYGRKDYATALAVLTPLSEQGDPVAEYYVGKMMWRGEGIARDPGKGYDLLNRAATAGIADAQNFMGMFNRRGNYVPVNYGEAMKWYLLAAKQGYKNAQMYIAVLYRDGKGTTKDIPTAYMWAVIASSEGDPTAQQLRAKLEPSLTEAQRNDARERAKQWLATEVVQHPRSIYSLTHAAP